MSKLLYTKRYSSVQCHIALMTFCIEMHKVLWTKKKKRKVYDDSHYVNVEFTNESNRSYQGLIDPKGEEGT